MQTGIILFDDWTVSAVLQSGGKTLWKVKKNKIIKKIITENIEKV